MKPAQITGYFLLIGYFVASSAYGDPPDPVDEKAKESLLNAFISPTESLSLEIYVRHTADNGYKDESKERISSDINESAGVSHFSMLFNTPNTFSLRHDSGLFGSSLEWNLGKLEIGAPFSSEVTALTCKDGDQLVILAHEVLTTSFGYAKAFLVFPITQKPIHDLLNSAKAISTLPPMEWQKSLCQRYSVQISDQLSYEIWLESHGSLHRPCRIVCRSLSKSDKENAAARSLSIDIQFEDWREDIKISRARDF